MEWTARAVRLMCSGLYVMPPEDVAHALGCSTMELLTMAEDLGVYVEGDIFPLWNDVEVGMLYDFDLSPACLDTLISKRSERDILCKCYALGLKTYGVRVRFWTAQEDAIMRRLYPGIHGDVAAYLPGRSPEACRSRARVLGLAKQRGA